MTRLVRRSHFLDLLFVVTVWKLNYVCGQNCDESSLRNCLSTLQKLVQSEFNMVFNKAELDDSCLAVLRESACILKDSEPCKDKFPSLTNLGTTLFSHLNQVCNMAYGRTTVYPQILPCFNKHKTDFEKCTGGVSGRDDQITNVCRAMMSVLCVADTSRKFCADEGVVFATSLESELKKPHEEMCNSTISTGVTLSISHWIMLLALAFLVCKHKLRPCT